MLLRALTTHNPEFGETIKGKGKVGVELKRLRRQNQRSVVKVAVVQEVRIKRPKRPKRNRTRADLGAKSRHPLEWSLWGAALFTSKFLSFYGSKRDKTRFKSMRVAHGDSLSQRLRSKRTYTG
jgi:hypothetical protein